MNGSKKISNSSYDKYLNSLGKQYEEYPYPERNPMDEKKRLLPTIGDMLGHINHYCFEGKRDFSKGFRVLVAGGGTGDALIFLAEQLRDADAVIVYLDFSQASMAVAKERAQVRQLTNIQWELGSLLDLNPLKNGYFDYINCSGVLHHLEKPSQGLAALNSVLKEDGVMLIMLYAEYGRTAIYQMQDLMRMVNKGESDMGVKMKNCKTIINALPESHWINISTKTGQKYQSLNEIELYDLFLIGTDCAYTIPQLYKFIEKEGLMISKLFSHMPQYGNRLYKPETYIHDVSLQDEVSYYDLREKQAIAELMNGKILMHTFYVKKQEGKVPVADLEHLNYIPYLSPLFNRQAYAGLYQVIINSDADVKLNAAMNIKVRFSKTPHMEQMFKYLDGEKTLKNIFDKVMKSVSGRKSGATYNSLLIEFNVFYSELENHYLMMLRDSSVHYPKSLDEMQMSLV